MHFFNLDQIFQLLEFYRYFLLFPIVIVEGPIVTVITGYLSYLGFLNFFVAYLFMVAGDLVGDVMYYSFGRWGRFAIIEKYGHYIGINTKKIEEMEKQFNAQGAKLLLSGKFTLGIGGPIILAAGALKINFGKFIGYSTLGTIPKALLLMLLGFYVGHAYLQIQKYFDYGSIFFVIIFILALLGYYFFKKRKK